MQLLYSFWVESGSNRATQGYRFQVARLGAEVGGWRETARGWRAASDIVLSPRGRVAGILLVALFMVALMLFLLPWAPSNMCPGLLLNRGFVISLLSWSRKASELLSGCIVLGTGSFLLSCCVSEGALCPAAVEGLLLSTLVAKWSSVLPLSQYLRDYFFSDITYCKSTLISRFQPGRNSNLCCFTLLKSQHFQLDETER